MLPAFPRRSSSVWPVATVPLAPRLPGSPCPSREALSRASDRLAGGSNVFQAIDGDVFIPAGAVHRFHRAAILTFGLTAGNPKRLAGQIEIESGLPEIQ